MLSDYITCTFQSCAVLGVSAERVPGVSGDSALPLRVQEHYTASVPSGARPKDSGQSRSPLQLVYLTRSSDSHAPLAFSLG